MATQGVGTFAINSFWESGRLIFYEKASGHTTTGNVFILGADYVQVGDTANDVDFNWKGSTTGTFSLDAAAHTLALTGMATSTDGAVTITNATATSSTTTGALIVTGGIATAADITCGDDLFMSNGGVINFNASNVTITHAAGALACTGALTLSIATASNSTTSGALIVTGGVGIAKELYVGLTSSLAGAITAGSTMGIAGLVTSTSVTGYRSNPTFLPDSTYSNYALAIGWKGTVNELAVNFLQSADQNFNPIQLNVNVTATGTGPTNSSQMNGIHQLITHDTNDMTFLRLKNADFNVVIGKDVKDAYCYQGEILFNTAAVTVGGEAVVLGLVANASVAVTGNVRGQVISMQGTGTYSTAVGLEIRTTCGTGLGAGLSEGIRIMGTPLPVVGIAMGDQTGDNQGPQFAFYFPGGGGVWGADVGPVIASGTGTGAITIKVGTDTRYIRFYTTA